MRAAQLHLMQSGGMVWSLHVAQVSRPENMSRKHRHICAGGKAAVTAYELHATLQLAAPDCFAKDVIVVNGEFQPTIRVRQGDILQVRPSIFPASLTLSKYTQQMQ